MTDICASCPHSCAEYGDRLCVELEPVDYGHEVKERPIIPNTYSCAYGTINLDSVAGIEFEPSNPWAGISQW